MNAGSTFSPATAEVHSVSHAFFSAGCSMKETTIAFSFLSSCSTNSSASRRLDAGRSILTLRRSKRPCRVFIETLSKYMTWKPCDTK